MRAGSRLPGSTPHNLYAVQDGNIAMAATSDSVFHRLAAVMKQPQLGEDPRFTTGLARVRSQDALDEVISAWTRTFTLSELEGLLQSSDVPASRIFTIADSSTTLTTRRGARSPTYPTATASRSRCRLPCRGSATRPP